MASGDIQFDTLPLSTLRGYERNARHHSRRQIKAIAASIREFGFTSPILVDETGEIIAGHGRFEAALSLGMASVPVIRILGLEAVQKRALRLADNKLALDSAWDVELLSSELADLTLTDFDITLTGFETIEVDRLTTPSFGPGDEHDAVPEPPTVPVSRTGDLWALGDHILAVGDAGDSAVTVQPTSSLNSP